ncbi:hypothetical protein [Burkholderia seminalis]|uniref:hypothetical protein n=1 Tax=Burkholderia seminalis TaxID=488731 RepID=UPI0031E30413
MLLFDDPFHAPGDRLCVHAGGVSAGAVCRVNPNSDFNLNWSESAEIVQQSSAKKSRKAAQGGVREALWRFSAGAE